MSRCIACDKIMYEFDLRPQTSGTLSEPEETYCTRCRYLSDNADYPSNYVHEKLTEKPAEIIIDK